MFRRSLSIGTAFVAFALSTASGQELPPLSGSQMLPQPTPSSSPLDEPIRQIADTAGRAVLDKDFPGLRQHSMYPFFKSMSLNQIAAMSKGQITPAMLAQFQTDLATIDATSTASAVPASATTAVDSTH